MTTLPRSAVSLRSMSRAELGAFVISRAEPRDDCLLWAGRVNRDGYGEVASGRYLGMAHRLAYESAKGPIPKGLVVDHICHDMDPDCPGGICDHRRCVNPDHLRPVTDAENLFASRHTLASLNVRRNGHEYTPDNTRLSTTGRECRACDRAKARRLYWQKKGKSS